MAIQAASEVTPSERVMASLARVMRYGVATEFSFSLRHRSRCKGKRRAPVGGGAGGPQQGARLLLAETLC